MAHGGRGGVKKQGNKVKVIAEMVHNKVAGQPNFIQGMLAGMTEAHVGAAFESVRWAICGARLTFGE